MEKFEMEKFEISEKLLFPTLVQNRFLKIRPVIPDLIRDLTNGSKR
jgi:hypothetical protein